MTETSIWSQFPLHGVRVVALEQAVAAPLCTRHLADLGADVVKIERPGGDFARRYDSVVYGQSGYFAWLNRGKRSVTMDTKLAADRELLEALLDQADVFVHNLGPGAVERMGYGWETLHERWPRLIVCGISGYGEDGPYRDRKAFDLLVQGESGVLSVTGTADEPAKVGISISDISAGMYALSSILASLYQRDRTGVGVNIDISMLECLAEWMMAPAYQQLYGGSQPPRTGLRHNMIVPYGPYRVGDGSVVNLAVQNEGQWERLCRVALGRADLVNDPRFVSNELRLRNRVELEPLIEQAFAGDTRDSLLERLDLADVPYGALNTVKDLLEHPQLAARDRWFEITMEGRPVQVLEHPMNIGGIGRRTDRIPGPGEDTDVVRAEMASRESHG